MDYESLRTAYLAHRREHGEENTDALIAAHGGTDTLESVPESRWPELAAAFKGDGSTAATKLAAIGAKAFDKRKANRS